MDKELIKDFCQDGKSYYQGGKFYPDTTPLEIPLGFQIPESLESMIARMVHNEVFYKHPEIDNVDEADDLDIMDEQPILPSNHEFTEMQEEHYRKEKKDALDAADRALNPPPSDQAKPQGGTQQPVQPVKQEAGAAIPAQQ